MAGKSSGKPLFATFRHIANAVKDKVEPEVEPE